MIRRVLLHVPLLLLVLIAASCATRTATAPVGASFVIVRHAEKANDDPKDPSLSEAGLARAQALAASLADAPLTAAYATAYRRTQMTAAPAAQAHGLTVVTYDAKQSPTDFAAQLRRTHGQGTVLVVGHSNTASEIAAALCACTVAPMHDDEFDRLLTIRIDATGTAKLSETRY
ncbi:MAG TPA: phosphoglycerate mutase family protein [Lysobacter sp.]